MVQMLLRLPQTLPLLLLALLGVPGAALRRSSVETSAGKTESSSTELSGIELHLPLAEVNLQEEANGPCTETVVKSSGETQPMRWVHYTCKIFRAGNAVMLYWNARALAFFKNVEFKVTVNRSGLVTNFPKYVPPPQGKPTELQQRLWKALNNQSDDVCWECPFPHGNKLSPWRIFGDVIFNDTVKTVEKMIRTSEDKRTKRYTDWSQRRSWGVLHFRCDKTLWKNEQYGFMRHSVIAERLPKTTTNMLIVGQAHSKEPLCGQILGDLVSWLQARHLKVAFQETNEADDWLTLATAPILFCSSSTYCLTAGMGNPNTVYFPMNGENMGVHPDAPELAGAASLRSPGFHFVARDYMPGPVAAELAWQDLETYLHADSCQEQQHRCVPVGGFVPEKYMFHKKKA
mmetsp:Transcript_139082/g.432713  ORF Transcript_139082/g.432713 Transcript_139082/m.432713 type:complete len:402 (-) Transcript_139082:83-1288(-)